MTKWDLRFLKLAEEVSNWSKDPSTRVGCVVVNSDRVQVSAGYNGFPRNIEDSISRLQNKELKYSMIVHAEANAICAAAKMGVILKDCTVYINLPPCSNCAALLIQAGIRKVVCNKLKAENERWLSSVTLAYALFAEAGVDYEEI